jgi:hypothetical protein
MADLSAFAFGFDETLAEARRWREQLGRSAARPRFGRLFGHLTAQELSRSDHIHLVPT